MASRADEVEALASQLDGAQIAHGMDDYDQDRCIAALREYVALLREDRCAPLVEALERMKLCSGVHVCVELAEDALRAFRGEES